MGLHTETDECKLINWFSCAVCVRVSVLKPAARPPRQPGRRGRAAKLYTRRYCATVNSVFTLMSANKWEFCEPTTPRKATHEYVRARVYELDPENLKQFFRSSLPVGAA